jgi:hypothetical protein
MNDIVFNPTRPKLLLTRMQAEHIASALATMNNLGVPYFKTVLPGNIVDHKKNEVLVFEWNSHRAIEVRIFLRDIMRPAVKFEGYPLPAMFSYKKTDNWECYADQAAFLDTYGV